MDQALRNSLSSDILTLAMSAIIAIGIALIYVRYLRRLRTPPHERTVVDTYGLLTLGLILILVGLSVMTFLFFIDHGIATIIVFILTLLVFTAFFVFTARRSYKKSL
jgi:drug/metabolite transporter (DMT)-like permease